MKDVINKFRSLHMASKVAFAIQVISCLVMLYLSFLIPSMLLGFLSVVLVGLICLRAYLEATEKTCVISVAFKEDE